MAANIMVESMYSQCDFNGNERLLLETFIDHRKNFTALCIEDPKVVVTRKETLQTSTAGWDICG